MDLGVFCCLESSVFLFEVVPQLMWLICSALNEKGGKGRLCLLEILWLRQLSLAAFTHSSLSKLQFNAACKLECRRLSWQHRQDRQEILEWSTATCCIWGDGDKKRTKNTVLLSSSSLSESICIQLLFSCWETSSRPVQMKSEPSWPVAAESGRGWTATLWSAMREIWEWYFSKVIPGLQIHALSIVSSLLQRLITCLLKKWASAWGRRNVIDHKTLHM